MANRINYQLTTFILIGVILVGASFCIYNNLGSNDTNEVTGSFVAEFPPDHEKQSIPGENNTIRSDIAIT